MNEKWRLFISHSHTDAAALSRIKDMLESMGFTCFLAHEDIPAGANDLDSIEREIRNCDAFLYVGSKKANASEFCQQEIGMAKALNKKIITAMTKGNPPTGFISRIQAITYKEIDSYFYDNVYADLHKKFPLAGELKKHLETLRCEGFSRTEKPNTVHLFDLDGDDFGFKTTFGIKIAGQDVGYVKIGFRGQTITDSTHDKLPSNFTHLSLPFFSCIFLNDKTPSDSIGSLVHLLNEIQVLSEEECNSIAHEDVYKVLLSAS